MRLTTCHIDGFGKLNNVDFHFDKGLNIIKEDNGYGKTTLATFIKVMLYGFDDENRKSLQDKEREKYRPWNKGIYGGRLGFEVNDKEYEVSRIFGKNEGDDSFEVRDKETNALIDIYTKTELGSQLFGIDKNSFFRTAYIASHDLNKREERITDSIRAKLGNLTDATDDINNYEKVCEKIDKKLNEYTPDRKTGKIKSLKATIKEVENECRRIDDIDKFIEINENQVAHIKDKIELNKTKLAKLNEEIKEVHKVNELKGKKETYNAMLADLEESKKMSVEAVGMIKGRVPSKEEINEQKSAYITSRQLIKEMDENHFYKDENWEKKESKYSESIPTENEIKEYMNLLDEIKNKKGQLLNLSAKLDRAVEDYYQKIKSEIEDKNQEIKTQTENKNHSKKNKRLLLLILGIIFIIAGVTLLILSKMSNMIMLGVGGAFILLAIVMIVLIFALKLNKMEEAQLLDIPELNKDEALNNSEEVKAIEKDIQGVEYEKQILEGQIIKYLNKYGYEYNQDSASGYLIEIMQEAAEYRSGTEKINKYNELRQKCETLENKNEQFFKEINVESEGSIEEIFTLIQEALVRKEGIEEEVKRRKSKIEAYEADNNISELLKELPEGLRTIDEIQDDEEEINEELELDRSNLDKQRGRVDEFEEERKQLLTKINEKEAMEETLKQYEYHYNLLQLTKDYLTRAKDGLSNKYTGPTMKAFSEYCNLFMDDTSVYRIDTDFAMTKMDEGLQRKIRELSAGQKDLTDLCLRMALVKAMYENEKPFIVMDDPFINLDDNNLNSGMELLNKLSEEYQIIYFTCNEARGGKR